VAVRIDATALDNRLGLAGLSLGDNLSGTKTTRRTIAGSASGDIRDTA